MENDILMNIDDDVREDEEILDGLGRAMRTPMNANTRAVARRFAARKVNKANTNSIQTRGQKYLNVKRDKFDPATRAKLQSGEMGFGDGVFYVRKAITAKAGIIEVFESSDTWDKTVGVTNLDKAKLPDYVNMALRRVEINFVTGTGIVPKTGQYAPMTSATDDALINAEIELKANSKQLFKVPARQFLTPSKQGAPANGYDLSALKDIKAGEDIQILIHFAGTMSGTVDLIEFVLIGDVTTLR